MKIAVVYDNKTLDPDLSPAWGFSCLVGDDLLFDTGGDSPRLLSNMVQMGLDVGRIKSAVLSHAHGDHTGGLAGLLAVNRNLTVYLPRSFPTRFKTQVRSHAQVVEVHEPMEIGDGIYTTGEMGRGLVEQALVLVTDQGPSTGSGQGLVVITGCAHPGIVNIVRKAKEVVNGEVYLVMGGFHLGGASAKAVEGIIADFRRLGVQKVAPCHCTGDRAIGMFAAEYGEDLIEIGVGMVLDIEP
jgi:7,8-dihydropterin-6-yl-methyl-4-(beta-D-ribofuranosyl)aminobenzene 5'-phosphate synthase